MTSAHTDPRREIGPAGTLSRVAVGLVAVTLPVALEGIGWWDVASLALFPLIAAVAARLIIGAYERYAPRALERRHMLCSGPGCILCAALYGAAVGIGAATPAKFDVVFWGFIGISMLVAAARGDGGCEVLAFPNAITGRSDRVGCIIFTPIDAAEARQRARGEPPRPYMGERS